jgi:four helix bundle protein
MLIAYAVAVDLISELRPIVDAIKRHDGPLADQIRRAASNTVGNLAEGQRRKAGNKNRAFENAHGEAREVLGHLDTARGWGYIVDDDSARVVLDRLLGLLWGLTHSKHERPRKSNPSSAST